MYYLGEVHRFVDLDEIYIGIVYGFIVTACSVVVAEICYLADVESVRLAEVLDGVALVVRFGNHVKRA